MPNLKLSRLHSSSYAFSILVSLLWLSCSNKTVNEGNILNYYIINSHNELLLTHTNDKYGEWDGDTFRIRLYRNTETKELQLDYTEYQGEAAPPPTPEPNQELPKDWFWDQTILFQKKNIKVTAEHLELISKSISELASLRIEHYDIPAMSGIHNKVMLSDSSLIIENYPSKKWNNFHTLKRAIKNK